MSRAARAQSRRLQLVGDQARKLRGRAAAARSPPRSAAWRFFRSHRRYRYWSGLPARTQRSAACRRNRACRARHRPARAPARAAAGTGGRSGTGPERRDAGRPRELGHAGSRATRAVRRPYMRLSISAGGGRVRRSARHRWSGHAGATGGGDGDRHQDEEADQPHEANPNSNQRVNGVSPDMVKKASPGAGRQAKPLKIFMF